MRRQLNTRSVPNAAPGGFTLIEAAMATVIIGVGVLAMIDAQQSFIRSNLWSNHAASATFLANEVREFTRRLPRHDPVVGLVIDGGTLYGWGPDAGELQATDFDDIDDFDGLTFADTGTPDWTDGDLPGPINAFGEVIPEITRDGLELGVTADDGTGLMVFAGQAMRGWFQVVTVEKVDPFDTSVSYADEYLEPPGAGDPGIPVDRFPLRVTVEVFYQSLNNAAPDLVTTVTWIVP